MDGSEALEDEVVDEGERGDTEEHEDGDEVAELAAEIHDVGNIAEDVAELVTLDENGSGANQR